jgi:hypothetical protein
MQLALHAHAKSATIKVRRIEILDGDGKRLDVLTSSQPTTWKEVGKYEPWDESIAANDSMAVSYTLSAPNWDKLLAGRFGDQMFRVRVTVAVGGQDRVSEKSVHAVAAPEPMIET